MYSSAPDPCWKYNRNTHALPKSCMHTDAEPQFCDTQCCITALSTALAPSTALPPHPDHPSHTAVKSSHYPRSFLLVALLYKYHVYSIETSAVLQRVTVHRADFQHKTAYTHTLDLAAIIWTPLTYSSDSYPSPPRRTEVHPAGRRHPSLTTREKALATTRHRDPSLPTKEKVLATTRHSIRFIHLFTFSILIHFRHVRLEPCYLCPPRKQELCQRLGPTYGGRACAKATMGCGSGFVQREHGNHFPYRHRS
ncbi:hypothetical protein K438DRAFT_1060681 [Mycena galopus ATCC 62051]|nr:hypothetical protein K438DRAFT_1060681 [Mycena galopus ATCC 62051]